jgi:hypothetical protein
MKTFECFWGDGYRSKDGKSILAYQDQGFFDLLKGYSEDDIWQIDGLEVGEYARFQESGDHWVRRIA